MKKLKRTGHQLLWGLAFLAVTSSLHAVTGMNPCEEKECRDCDCYYSHCVPFVVCDQSDGACLYDVLGECEDPDNCPGEECDF